MKFIKQILLAVAIGLFAVQAQAATKIDVAFSPDGGSEQLVLNTISSARQSIRMSAYSFTSPAVIKALINAKRRGVDVKIVIDEKGNRSKASTSAKNLIVNAGIPLRTNSRYAILHDKYIVVDGKTVETGSFNYSKNAALRNSENVIVIWNDTGVANSYLSHWQSRWDGGVDVTSSY